MDGRCTSDSDSHINIVCLDGHPVAGLQSPMALVVATLERLAMANRVGQAVSFTRHAPGQGACSAVPPPQQHPACCVEGTPRTQWCPCLALQQLPELVLLTAPNIREYFYTEIRFSTPGSNISCIS
jgi:hypothetical protein